MNVFVLCTGRCGSLTFARACTRITNYTSGHETRAREWRDRLSYPDGHIEVDHRLSWFLGSLERLYDAPRAVYVHLTRGPRGKISGAWRQGTVYEGMEPDVIAGGQNTLRRWQPDVYAETWDQPAHDRLDELLRPLGYEHECDFGKTTKVGKWRVR